MRRGAAALQRERARRAVRSSDRELQVYLLRSDLIAAPGAAAELEGYLGRAFAAMRTQPGFVRALLGNAPGQPAVYLSLVIWQSREAARGWSRGEAGRPFRDELRRQTFL